MRFWKVNMPIFALLDLGVYFTSVFKRSFNLIDLVENIFYVI